MNIFSENAWSTIFVLASFHFTGSSQLKPAWHPNPICVCVCVGVGVGVGGWLMQLTIITYTVHGRLAPVLKTIFINASCHILVTSLTLMALFLNRAIRVRLATSIYDTLMKNCFKDWSQSK